VSCDDINEDLAHVFFECPIAVQVWRMSDLWDEVQHAFALSTTTVFAIFYLLQELPSAYSQRFVAIVWSVWKHRNLKLWQNENETCAQIVERARHLVEDW